MNAYQKEVTADEYEALLNDSYGTVSVCCYDFLAGTALRELDNIAFNNEVLECESDTWICGNCGDEFECEDDANSCCQESDYMCTRCKSEHDNQDEADECCQEQTSNKQERQL